MEPDPAFDQAATSIKISPGWVNARYLRTLSWLAQGDFSKRDYMVLWVFACLDAQLGFAGDLAVEYEKRFGQDDTSRFMLSEALRAIRRLGSQRQSVFDKAKALFPFRLK